MAVSMDLNMLPQIGPGLENLLAHPANKFGAVEFGSFSMDQGLVEEEHI
jgi:hypothetical protein